MSKRSVDKGKAGERELAGVAREHGLPAERTAQLQAGRREEGAPDVTVYTWPQLHVEVKRDERMSVDAMVRQSVAHAAKYRGEARVPIVAWRRNGSGRNGWRVDCPAGHYFDTLAEVDRLRAQVAELRDALGDCSECGESLDGYGPDWCRTHLDRPSPKSATTTTPEDR